MTTRFPRFLILILSSMIAAHSSGEHEKLSPATVPRGALRGWNVVLVTLDATDSSRIGAYGGSARTMPFFDSLARKGLLADRAYTITGSTSPAHATILSGTLPDQHAVRYNGLPLSHSVFWLPEEFHEQGYVTVG